jgi:hypothetical protein
MDALATTHLAQMEALRRDLEATHALRIAELQTLHSETVVGLQLQVASAINNHQVCLLVLQGRFFVVGGLVLIHIVVLLRFLLLLLLVVFGFCRPRSMKFMLHTPSRSHPYMIKSQQ